MTTTPTQQPSNLLDYLPAIYQTDPFVGQFLLAFEKILLGTPDDNKPFPTLQNDHKFPEKGIEEVIAELSTYFDPLSKHFDPLDEVLDEGKDADSLKDLADFFKWLASWTALSLREDIEFKIQRAFVANIIKYYQLRGTKKNLEDLLKIFVKGEPSVKETGVSEVQVGVREGSTIGKNMYLGGGAPHFFTVTIVLTDELQKESQDPNESPLETDESKGKQQYLRRQVEIADALIQLEKPAHTNYKLITIYPGTIQIGKRKSSILGVNTILGNIPQPISKPET